MIKRTLLLHFFLWLLVGAIPSFGQMQSFSFRFSEAIDTLKLDSLWLEPTSLVIISGRDTLQKTEYSYTPGQGFVFTSKHSELTIQAFVFPKELSSTERFKDRGRIVPDEKKISDPFAYTFSSEKQQVPSFLRDDGLQKSGSISRGVLFGNNQDLSVNSSLNLQLDGKITEKLKVTASVSDNNIPIQPDGNTQQLQDFDQVFIKVHDDRSSLVAGDFWMKRPTGHFMVYNKRAQGASFSLLSNPADSIKGKWSVRASGAVSKGKFARNIIQGIEGNQGPYRLRGAENELFIIVLAGTERVFIDGELMQRGQDQDYVIDYNTAELTFTPNRLITKDRRIIVEFQYSDKNYARSIFESSNGYEKGNWKFYLNAYSEQDSKNQPLQQDLNDPQKALLAAVGDSIQDAFSLSIDSLGFSEDLVLYKMIDSLGYDSVLVFSVSPDSAFFRASFTNVGAGNGDYVIDQFTALGKTYRWVAPDTISGNIIKRGDHAPVILLVAPKKRQMINAGAEFKWGKTGRIFLEAAYSNTDINTFSPRNNEDNSGVAVKAGMEKRKALNNQNEIAAAWNVEFLNRNFQFIERYRPAEFERNWNVLGKNLSGDQLLGDASIALRKRRKYDLSYGFSTFLAGNIYEGFNHRLKTYYNHKGWFLDANASWMTSKSDAATSFLRHKSVFSKTLGRIKLGYRDEHELNTFSPKGTDSLAGNSYQFHDWQFFLQNADSSRNQLELYYRRRTDKYASGDLLSRGAYADHYGGSFEWKTLPGHRVRLNAAYRELFILDTLLTNLRPDQTLIGRVEYDLRLFKNALTWSAFYEIGTGLELKREFIYLQVPAGQGIYAWIDYNENGIKELNEFEIAAFPDQAQYIRSFVPSNEYVKTFTNQFNQTLTLNPANLWRRKKGIRKALSYFSDQAVFQIDRKTNTAVDRFNPFLFDIADTALISFNTSFRNTLFLNRSGAVFGAEYTIGGNAGKSLLTNGFDSRRKEYQEIRLRWNIKRKWGIVMEGETGSRSSLSDFLAGRNFSILYNEIRPSLSFQPGTVFRVTAKYRYSEKFNSSELGGQSAFINDAGLELRFNAAKKGSFLANANTVIIRFDGESNSSIGFEMLEALKPGTNYTWSAAWQQNLGQNLQLTLNYNGRKSENVRAIHTGGVQVRAFF